MLEKEKLEKFSIYLEALKKWNRIHNLTSIREDREIIIKHFLDSLSLARCFEDLNLSVKGKSIADVGSGAGFPGVPLKIYYGNKIRLVLIESASKKCSFLEYIKSLIGENYEVLCDRAENLSIKVDIAVARALGDIRSTEDILSKVAKEFIFIMKGSKLTKDLEKKFNRYMVNLKYLPSLYILWKSVNFPVPKTRKHC